MAVKPSNLAEFGTGSAPIVEPTLPQKQAGWTSGFKPPAQWLNWWMNLVYQWILWLNAFETDPHTWVGLQTFGSATVSGAAILNGASTFNALATFNNAVSAKGASAGVGIAAVTLTDGHLKFSNGSPNPSSSTALFNQLTAANIVKAWGQIIWASGAPTLTVGSNILAVSTTGAGAINVTFPLAGAVTYPVLVCSGSDDGAIAPLVCGGVFYTGAMHFYVRTIANVPVVFSSSTGTLNFVVLGTQ